LPIAIDEGVKCGVPKPIGRNATDGGIVGNESIGLFLREDGLGVQANASGMDYGSACRRLDYGRSPTTTGKEKYGRYAGPQVIVHVGITRKGWKRATPPCKK
jgi:hypothetical protein